MIILGIETSCDETALSLIDADSKTRIRADGEMAIRVLADKTLSQSALHKQYGGVFPNLAKREHGRNLVPLLKTVLADAGLLKEVRQQHSHILKNVRMLLEREKELVEQFTECIQTVEKPRIDAIAVTEGPGLEPCLWTGINFAKALSLVWKIPVIPVNHMEGHIFSALLRRKECNTRHVSQNNKDDSAPLLHATCYMLHVPVFPALALLISGGHTELVLIRDYFKYEIIGQTRDDAVGEAFDKVARLLGLPYPGGPEISRLAEQARQAEQGSTLETGKRSNLVLPRPMLHSSGSDFSFSGLKTAVLYLLKKIEKEAGKNHQRSSAFSIRDNPRLQQEIAREFEDAVTEVLITKTHKAMEQYGAKTLLIGGGVIANIHIRRSVEDLANTYGRKYLLNGEFLHIPEPQLTTDNALMIAVAGFLRLTLRNGSTRARKGKLTAKGNLRLDKK